MAGRGSADALVEHSCFTIPLNDSGAICANAVGKRAYATIEAESAHLLSRTMTFHAVRLEEGLDIATKIGLRGKRAGTQEPKGQHQERAKSTSGARRYAGGATAPRTMGTASFHFGSLWASVYIQIELLRVLTWGIEPAATGYDLRFPA